MLLIKDPENYQDNSNYKWCSYLKVSNKKHLFVYFF